MQALTGPDWLPRWCSTAARGQLAGHSVGVSAPAAPLWRRARGLAQALPGARHPQHHPLCCCCGRGDPGPHPATCCASSAACQACTQSMGSSLCGILAKQQNESSMQLAVPQAPVLVLPAKCLKPLQARKGWHSGCWHMSSACWNWHQCLGKERIYLAAPVFRQLSDWRTPVFALTFCCSEHVKL